jgi:hypothetical protein
MKRTLLLFSFIWVSYSVYSAECYSIGDGDWADASSWSCGAIPQCGDTIVISSGDKITITSQIGLDNCPDHTLIIVEGDLAFTNGNKLRMGCNSTFSISPTGVVYKDGNGGGNSSFIEQCFDDIIWSAGDGDFYGPYNWFGPLPIELTSFNVKANKDNVLIKWITASERNNDFFTIERSKDGQLFTPIDTINGAGNSSSEISYQEKDINPVNGVSYYRLKQTDFNGDTTLSDIKSVKFIMPDINIYPNPAETFENITITSGQYSDLVEDMNDYSLEVISIDGKIIPVSYIKNKYQITVEGIKVAGSYFVRLYDETSSQTIPLIVH